jgi:putative DNA-invertase from lambdoid prophage Rac
MTKLATAGRTFGYCRVSTAGQVEGTSLSDQQRRIEAVAKYHGRELTRIYTEEGVSGSIPLGQRPLGFELMAGLKNGDTLIVSKLDRAFRSVVDALGVIERLRIRGVQLILADISTEPLGNDGVGRMFFTLMAAFAEFERERIRERITAGKRRTLQAGGYGGGGVPVEMAVRVDEATGKKTVYVPAENEPVLAEGRMMRQNGVSVRDIETIIKERHPEHELAQAMVFQDWHRYFKRIALPPVPRDKPRRKHRKTDPRAYMRAPTLAGIQEPDL